jgi:hypothetical protein
VTKKEKLRKIWEQNPKFDRAKAARDIPLDKRQAQRYVKEFETGIPVSKQSGVGTEGVHKEFSDNTGCIELNSYTICDKDDALRVANIDLDTWDIAKYTFNSWQVTMKLRKEIGRDKNGKPIYEDEPKTKTNYQHKFELKLKIPHPFELAVQRLIKEVPKFQSNKAPKFIAPSGIAGEMALFDAHLAKLAWAAETGRRDYDLDIGASDYINACSTNLAWMTPFKPEKIFYVLGHDYMHFENYSGTTWKGGNVLDVDSRLPKVIYTAIETQIKCISMCRTVAPVDVIWVPGNHDEHASLWLACLIDHHFKDDRYVTVDISACKRKARLWGNLLVGWAHDMSRKYPSWNNELSQAFPKLWGKSVFREWHCGHKHKKMETKMHPIITQGGVLIRQLTALSPIDAWHFENLFTDAVPGGEALLWSKDHGVIANFTAWSDAPVVTERN